MQLDRPSNLSFRFPFVYHQKIPNVSSSDGTNLVQQIEIQVRKIHQQYSTHPIYYHEHFVINNDIIPDNYQHHYVEEFRDDSAHSLLTKSQWLRRRSEGVSVSWNFREVIHENNVSVCHEYDNLEKILKKFQLPNEAALYHRFSEIIAKFSTWRHEVNPECWIDVSQFAESSFYVVKTLNRPLLIDSPNTIFDQTVALESSLPAPSKVVAYLHTYTPTLFDLIPGEKQVPQSDDILYYQPNWWVLEEHKTNTIPIGSPAGDPNNFQLGFSKQDYMDLLSQVPK
jgi:hypothetical protein